MSVPQKVVYTTTGLKEAGFFLVLTEPPTLCFIVHASSDSSVIVNCQIAIGQVRLRGNTLKQFSPVHKFKQNKLLARLNCTDCWT